MGDYYNLLGIHKGASEGDIRTAYRKQAKRYHPDVNKAPDAHAKFIMLQTAYETLIDSHRRDRYDQRVNNYRTPNTSMDSYSEWLKMQKAKAEFEAKMRYYEFIRNREKFRESRYYSLAKIITHMARIICYLFGAGIIAICLFLIIDFHFVLLFFLLPFICGGVFLIKWSHQWYLDTKRYF